MKPVLGKFLKAFDIANEAASIFLLLTTVVVVFVAAASRYVFKNPVPWTEEVARFAFIWLAFVGVSIAERMKVHFRITYFINMIPERQKRYVWLFDEVLVFAALAYLLFEGLKFGEMGARGISAVLEIRLNFIYIALPVAVGLTMINRLRNGIEILISGKATYFEAIGSESANAETAPVVRDRS